MKILQILALALSLAAASLSVVNYIRPPNRWEPKADENLSDMALSVYRDDGVFWANYGRHVFQKIHRREILRSINFSYDTSPDQKLALVLVSYKAAGKEFHDSLWARKIENVWVGQYLSRHHSDAVVVRNMDWVVKAEDKRDAWEKNNPSEYE